MYKDIVCFDNPAPTRALFMTFFLLKIQTKTVSFVFLAKSIAALSP